MQFVSLKRRKKGEEKRIFSTKLLPFSPCKIDAVFSSYYQSATFFSLENNNNWRPCENGINSVLMLFSQESAFLFRPSVVMKDVLKVRSHASISRNMRPLNMKLRRNVYVGYVNTIFFPKLNLITSFSIYERMCKKWRVPHYLNVKCEQWLSFWMWTVLLGWKFITDKAPCMMQVM